jgi:hypothetical protein
MVKSNALSDVLHITTSISCSYKRSPGKQSGGGSFRADSHGIQLCHRFGLTIVRSSDYRIKNIDVQNLTFDYKHYRITGVKSE